MEPFRRGGRHSWLRDATGIYAQGLFEPDRASSTG